MIIPLLATLAFAQARTPIQTWQDARFGMFIHWGPVTLKGTEIGWSRGDQVSIEEYDNLYKRFNPTKFDAQKWAHLAKEAGMKYVVLTAKHHDGFCLWDTKQTDYNIMNSPFHRDVVRELSQACRKEGIAFGTYYSTLDWHHPDFPLTSPGGSVRRPVSNLDRYNDYLDAQVKELIQNYGPLWTIWFDVPQEFDKARGERVIAKVKALQPNLVVNDRTGAEGDYRTPEQTIGQFDNTRPWETCMTIANQWAWKPNDPVKSLKQCITTLVKCAGGDGNLLFNIGPKSDGEVEPEQVARLKEMGEWMKKYGETIYGTRGGPVMPTGSYVTTRKGDKVFVHVLNASAKEVNLPALGATVIGSRILSGGKVKVTSAPDGISIDLSKAKPNELDRIVELKVSVPANDLPVVKAASDVDVKTSNTFGGSEAWSGEKAFDGDVTTRWATDSGTKSAWIEASFHKPITANGITIVEAFAGRVTKFRILGRPTGGREWQELATGTRIGEHYEAKFSSIKLDGVKLEILEATEGPTISEITLEPAP